MKRLLESHAYLQKNGEIRFWASLRYDEMWRVFMIRKIRKRLGKKCSLLFFRATQKGEMPRVFIPRLKRDGKKGSFKSHLFVCVFVCF